MNADNLWAFCVQKSEKPALTKREREILSIVTEGRSNQEIASALFVAEVTVRKKLSFCFHVPRTGYPPGSVIVPIGDNTLFTRLYAFSIK